MRDEQFYKIFSRLVDFILNQTSTSCIPSFIYRVASDVKKCFNPDVIVMQCGADMLSSDPIGTFSLTPHGLGDIVHYILQWDMPTLLLGGGGYNFANTARCWTICTALAVDKKLTNEIPEHDMFKHYGPDFELTVTPSNRPNENSDKSIQEILKTVYGYLENIKTTNEH